VKIVDDETVPGEEDELGVPVQGPTDEKQVGWRSPAAAGKREGGMSTAAEAAEGWCSRARFVGELAGTASAQLAAVVDGGRARIVTGRATHLVAALVSAPCNFLPGGYEVGIFEDTET
jgi:hypothetical protein